jgi:hypothetical protein
MPFSAVHRILPLGVFGVTMNIFTGMLMLMADTFRYVNETSFIPKMFLLPIGASAVLYFSLNDALWATKANEDAPMQAKWFRRSGAARMDWRDHGRPSAALRLIRRIRLCLSTGHYFCSLLAVAIVVLGASFTGMYFLNKAIDGSNR